MRKLALPLLLLLFAVGTHAQAVVAPLELVRQQFFSPTGIPLANGCLTFNATGTSNPQAIYSDSTGLYQASNPYQLDSAGMSNIWLTNTGYDITAYTGGQNQSCAAALGTQLWTQTNINPFSIVNIGSNFIVAGGTSDPSAATAGELNYRTDLGCLRVYTTIWDCLVENTTIATLTNKTLTNPIINGGTITGATLATPMLTSLILNGAATGTGIQGTDTKLQTAGTNSGVVGATLCNDALAGATTSNCVAFPTVVYSTPSAAVTSVIASTNMIASVVATATYRISAYATQTVLGSSCSSTPNITVSVTYQDSNATVPQTQIFEQYLISGNGVLGNIPVSSSAPLAFVFRANTGTAIQYSTTYGALTGCSTNPTYQIFPILEQLTAN